MVMKFEAIMNDEASFSTDHNESILKLDEFILKLDSLANSFPYIITRQKASLLDLHDDEVN
jgi:hypothetical protein